VNDLTGSYYQGIYVTFIRDTVYSTGPCRRGLRGCPLHHLPEYRLVEVQA